MTPRWSFTKKIIYFFFKYCTARQCWLIRPILVQCFIITLTFIGLRNHLVIGQLNEYQFFSAFHWSTSGTPPASQCITVPRSIFENTVRAVHSCNSWFNKGVVRMETFTLKLLDYHSHSPVYFLLIADELLPSDASVYLFHLRAFMLLFVVCPKYRWRPIIHL